MAHKTVRQSVETNSAVSRFDPLWSRIRLDASAAMESDPSMAGLMQQAV